MQLISIIDDYFILTRLFIVLFAIIPVLSKVQNHFAITLDEYQQVENPNTSYQSQMRLPQKETVVNMGGLNDLDGIGNYLNIYGSKLLLDSITTTFNGEHAVVLRREDRRDFYNLFCHYKCQTNPLTPIQEK